MELPYVGVDDERWGKSSRSMSNGNCVETTVGTTHMRDYVLVRNSRYREQGHQTFTLAEWVEVCRLASEDAFPYCGPGYPLVQELADGRHFVCTTADADTYTWRIWAISKEGASQVGPALQFSGDELDAWIGQATAEFGDADGVFVAPRSALQGLGVLV